MTILEMLWDKVTGNQEEDFDLSKTPWKLHLKTTVHTVDVFLYFATHEEAKDQEDRSMALGWSSLGVCWHS